MTLRRDSRENELLLFAALLTLESSFAAMAIALYMKGARPFSVFLSTTPGKASLFAGLACVLSIAVIIHQYVAGRRGPSRNFRMILAMNLITVMLILSIGEIAVRAGSHMTPKGEIFGKVLLRPKNWDKIADEYRPLLEQASGDASYIQYDDLMGWTLEPNKSSSDGLYYSSAEGIRAPQVGISFAKDTEKTRIALVGDSFTFGEEVEYEDTWGYRLEKDLGPDVEVLDFGVPGYSVGQAYLRYGKDVRDWHPKIVIFGLISHDINRSLWVYPFLSAPDWKVPFSKPRHILRQGRLVNINVPPLPPDSIFARGSVLELPYLKYDRGYTPYDWEERFFHHSYLARLVVSIFPRWIAAQYDNTDKALVSVNAKILKEFVRSATQDGAIPLLVYFPSGIDLASTDSTDSLGRRVLQKAGLPYTDPTPCLLEVPSSARFAAGHHYSPQGNAAVAKCLAEVIREVLGHAPGEGRIPEQSMDGHKIAYR
ncbi:SGNH/GDSL hydrolase family protein [Nitrospira sp. BLG_2]|uniref:SGNH/GDSL hydrolase family protein n=1 Tax=Nitrospira sp. BLG_2 TaxID=3397507 RepID=UPI003B99D686